MKKKPATTERKAKVSDALKGQKGTKWSDEQRQKIVKALTGVKRGAMSPESKEKLSASKTGKKLFIDPVTGKGYMDYPTRRE